jgi:hypothetical protein
LHTLESSLGVIDTAFGEPFDHAGTLASDISHLLWECQFAPSAFKKFLMLNQFLFLQK